MREVPQQPRGGEVKNFFKEHRVTVIVTAIVLAICIAIYAFVGGFWLDRTWLDLKWFTRVLWQRQLFPSWNPWYATPLTMLLGSVVFAGIAYVFYKSTPSRMYQERKVAASASRSSTPVRVLVGLAVMSLVTFGATLWGGTNDFSQSYSSATTFVVPDQNNKPASLSLYAGPQVTTGTYSANWQPRVSSAESARIGMSRTSGNVPGTEMLPETLTYVYDKVGTGGHWTEIRDGKNRQPIYGIVAWDGSSATECKFTPGYSIRYAFDGRWGQNLSNVIAGRYQSLFYDSGDVWGYCDGDKPVIVIPVKSQEPYAHRTTMRSAGILIIKGSSSGEPVIEHRTVVKAGEFGGPVYPASLAVDQRNAVGMMAGRLNRWQRHFGFETLSGVTQDGNVSDYLLRSKTDGRLYWVTPLRSNASDSQLVVAYQEVLADEVNPGLNKSKIYVLADGDKRVINLDDLEARTRQAVTDMNPGFSSSGGKLVEMLPVDDESWQVYAEMGGRVVYRISVPADAKVAARVDRIDAQAQSPSTSPSSPTASTGSTSACGQSPQKMTNTQIAQCLKALADEVGRRNK